MILTVTNARLINMDDAVLTALLSLAGTAIGSIAGILASNKLTNFRLKSLEDRVSQHNHLVERMYEVEDRAKANQHRIDKIEERLDLHENKLDNLAQSRCHPSD